jgi:hypothetical protein
MGLAVIILTPQFMSKARAYYLETSPKKMVGLALTGCLQNRRGLLYWTAEFIGYRKNTANH